MHLANFDECVNAALRDKKISKDVARQILASRDPNASIDGILGSLSKKRQDTARSAIVYKQRYNEMTSHPRGVAVGLDSLLTMDPYGKAPWGNIELRGHFYKSKYHAKMADFESRFKTTMVGFKQDEEGLLNFVRALYGEAIDDPNIQKLAKDFHEVSEITRKDFNKFGGRISKNERWLLPQNHDPRTIQKFGLEVWKEDIKKWIDTSQMFDDAGEPLTKQIGLFDRVDESLDHVYETIVTGGLNKVKPGVAPRIGKKLSRRHGARRFLYFKDANSWTEYNNKYGRGDVITAVTDHLDTMGNDVALLDLFGPNPDNTYQALVAASRITGYEKWQSNAIYNVASGKLNRGDLTTAADFMEASRNVITSATLGGAFLSSLSDIGYAAITANWNGIPAFATLKRQLSLLAPSNVNDRVFATKMGIIYENVNRASSGNRYTDSYGTGITAKVAEGVMRASFLQPWTEMGRKAFGMEFSSLLADNFGTQFDDLNRYLKRSFSTYGITKRDWDLFRSSSPLDHKGAKFADMLEPGGIKFHQMVMSEMDYAVPTPNARVRAFTTGGLARATPEGQMWRTLGQLKSFPITMVTTHLYRAAFQATGGEKIQYIGLLAASSSIFGGLALLAKDIAAGREPRPTDSVKFVVAAFAQGGGIGIFGDYAFSDANRYGQSFVGTLFGPTGELIDKSWRLSVGNIQEKIRSEETNTLGESIDFVKRYTPDIWQTRLFTDAFYDQVKLLADDNAQRKYNRIVRKRKKDYEQGYWWKPGEPLPEAMQ